MFESEDVFLHINESIEDTFTAMTFGDIFMLSPSCFSVCAAVLSNGLTYYPTPGQEALFQRLEPHTKAVQILIHYGSIHANAAESFFYRPITIG